MSFQYSISFLIGLQATLHCVGMCGPLAFAAPINRSTTKTAVWGTLTYNFGRIATYSYLGFLLGIIGIGQTWIYAIQLISALTGLVFIASAIFGSLENWPIWRPFTRRIGTFSAKLFPIVKKSNPTFRPFLFGLINGLLPCGMVYLALLHGLSGSSLLETILSMLFFGLGTLPVMFFIPLMGQERFYHLLPRQTQKILLVLIGFLLILRGFGLGIPYVSPKVETPGAPNSQPSIECCEVQP
ncbi:MAG: sulfite exporter TauE/SafE family protein [Flavobacteriales bacterium]